MQDLGYDIRLLPPRDIRCLDAVRLVINKSMDTVKGTETEAPASSLTPVVRTSVFRTGTELYNFATLRTFTF